MKNLFLKSTLLFIVIVTLGGCKQKVEQITVTGADGKEYTSYITACSNGDYDAAREFVEKMKVQQTNAKANKDYHLEEALKESIQEAEDYIFNEEIQYLASLNDEQANNRLVLIINRQSVEGTEFQEGTCLGKKINKSDLDDYGGQFDHYDDSPAEVRSYRKYISWSENHNSKCNNILNIAISCGNENLAKKIIHMYRKDPELLLKNEKKESGNLYYDVYAHYTNGSRDAAQKKYDEAVKSGAFN